MVRRIVFGMAVMGLVGMGAARAEAVGAAGYSHEAAKKLYQEAKYKEDEALCKAAIAEVEKTKGDKSRELAEPLDDLASIYLRESKFKDAGPVIERAESVLDKSKPADAILLGRIAINKGWRLYALQQVGDAQKVFEQGRELIEKNQKGDSVDLAELINNLGLTYADSDDPDAVPDPKRVEKAKLLLYKGWQMRQKLTGQDSPETGESLNNIGMHLLFHGEGPEDMETAITALKKSLAISEKVYGKDHPETAVSEVNLAAALHEANDDAGALALVKQAIPMTEKAFGKDNLDRSYELQMLGTLQQADGKFTDAEGNYKEAVRILEAVFGKDDPNVAGGLDALKGLYEVTGDEAKEKAVIERIDRIRGEGYLSGGGAGPSLTLRVLMADFSWQADVALNGVSFTIWF